MQLVEFMKKEEELLSKFPELDPLQNLQNGSSAAAVAAVVGDQYASTVAAAAMAGDAASTLAAASASASTGYSPVQDVVLSTEPSEEAVPSAAAAAAVATRDGATPALPQPPSLLPHLVHGAEQQQLEGPWSADTLVAQLQALQQRLPGQLDVAGLLSGYQTWLDQVKGRLLQQHEETQVCYSTKR